MESVMDSEHNPIDGTTQPGSGVVSPLRYVRMGRPPKISTPKDIIGQVLSENIAQWLPVTFPRAPNRTAQIEALAKRSGVAEETIRRIMTGEVSPRLDNIDAIARALGTTASKLLSTDGRDAPLFPSERELQQR